MRAAKWCAEISECAICVCAHCIVFNATQCDCMFVMNVIAVVRLASPQNQILSIVAAIASARFSMSLSISEAHCAAESVGRFPMSIFMMRKEWNNRWISWIMGISDIRPIETII